MGKRNLVPLIKSEQRMKKSGKPFAKPKTKSLQKRHTKQKINLKKKNRRQDAERIPTKWREKKERNTLCNLA